MRKNIKGGGKNESYRTCDNAGWNEYLAGRLVRQKYRTVSGFIWTDHWCLSNNGIKSLEDLAAHFWNGEKDMWYLGMDVEYKGW